MKRQAGRHTRGQGRENRWGEDELLAQAMGLDSPKDPFPWQRALLARFRKGSIPDALDIPTGLGKTSVMAVWLVARAFGAPIPRRLVYVVDRRAVVDQATTEAERLREFVNGYDDIRDALGLTRPLPISTLRGQHVDNREWLEDPAAPAIIVGTVDMIGSRLLFEGYGVTRKMRPFHAGLLGADALVVLDEAHLVPPFEHLLRSIATDGNRGARVKKYDEFIPPFWVLPLSATGRGRSGCAITLTEEDFEHEVVAKRMNAKKSIQIQLLNKDDKLENALAKAAWALAGGGKEAVRVLVYADSRDIVQKAKKAIERLAKGNKKAGVPRVPIDTELLVGGRRVFERRQAMERLRRLGFLAGSTLDRSGPVFLFSTSAGEVGVDLDADHMVCDLVTWERMVQRLGRVNRRGDGEADVIVLVKPPKKTKEKETQAIEDWQRPMRALHRNDDGSFDGSPGALLDLKARAAADESLQRVLDQATTPEPLRPALTRPLVQAWAMTSLEEHTGRPAIQPWLRGWLANDPPQTSVVWRTHLPVRVGGASPRKKEIEGFFEAAPPHLSEVLETETFRVVKWLAARAKRVGKQQARQDGAGERPPLCPDDVVAFALGPDGKFRASFSFAKLTEKKQDDLKKALSGATLILDARLGGLKDGLLDDAEAGVPRTADDGEPWLDEGVVGFRVRRIEASEGVLRDGNWRERLRFASKMTEDGETVQWLVVEKWRHDAATEEDRSAANPQLLEEHEEWTEKRARYLAQAIGLSDQLAEVLALAARLHDEGKRAKRWQRAFHAPVDGVYAKTEGPIDYRLLDGYRHELGSVLRVEQDGRIQALSDEHRDLVLHLIAAHHGFARPVIGTSGCDDKPPSALEEKAAEIALRFVRLMERWGPWGLAWWEALLRASDQQASRDNDARGNTGGAT